MGETIHIKKFQDGRITPREMWRQTLNLKCSECGSRAVEAIARMFCPLMDWVRDFPMEATIAYAKGQPPQAVPLRAPDGTVHPFVRVKTLCMCTGCQPQVERFLAAAPSYYVVQFDRGPQDIRPQVQVA